MNLDQALQTFIIEARELLDDMEAALLNVASEEDPSESINAIFRAAHTIKGSAGLFGLDPVVAFTHVAESLLDEVRAGSLALGDELVQVLLASRDHIGRLIDTVEAHGDTAEATLDSAGQALIARLRHHMQGEATTAGTQTAADADPAVPAAQDAPQSAGHWHLSLRFGAGVMKNGMDPLSFIRYLGVLGRVLHIETLADALPRLDEMDPESCYLGFELAFASTADRAAIENVFEFVADDCMLSLLPPGAPAADFAQLMAERPEDPERLAAVLVACGSVSRQALDEARQSRDAASLATGSTAAQPASAGLAALLPQAALVNEVATAAAGAAPARQKAAREGRSAESQSIRVDADKLDHLINLVGELIIASAGANLLSRRIGNAELQERHSTLSNLVEEVRDSALQLRMVKIGATFNRFQRVVHDISRELGKDIVLAVSGEDTELDKTVVEKIGDPLTHLVRNAMDHGIGTPEYRLARGKPAQGTVSLNAFHDSGHIVIEVSDDGKGLSRERILAKAQERGLVEAGRTYTDSEIYDLIFEPGFSTADQVTNLSGRGVGMDVVKRNITALRGSVHLESEPGKGTKVTVRLPLTLAIINGFQVGVGKSVFVMPLDMVDECIEFSSDAGHDYTNLRGQVLPFIRLRDLFEVRGEPGARQNIVVVKHAGQKFGLVVDTLVGEAQTVIKPLSKMFAQVRGISGSSILASGDVALILDVPVLLQECQQHKPADRPQALV